MSQNIRKEVLQKMRQRYVGRGIKGKSVLITELCEQWGYSRKHAIKLLNKKAGCGGREHVDVKLLTKDKETFVLAQSRDRIAKERSMRRRRLRKYLKALADLNARKRPLKNDQLHQAIGAAKKEAGRDARHVKITVTLYEKEEQQYTTLSYQLNRASLRLARRREGRYLLRTNLTDTDPAKLWNFYLQLTEVEQALNLKTAMGHGKLAQYAQP